MLYEASVWITEMIVDRSLNHLANTCGITAHCSAAQEELTYWMIHSRSTRLSDSFCIVISQNVAAKEQNRTKKLTKGLTSASAFVTIGRSSVLPCVRSSTVSLLAMLWWLSTSIAIADSLMSASGHGREFQPPWEGGDIKNSFFFLNKETFPKGTHLPACKLYCLPAGVFTVFFPACLSVRWLCLVVAGEMRFSICFCFVPGLCF